MKKRLLALLLVLALAFALTACGSGTGNDDPQAEEAGTEETLEVSEPEPEEEEEAEPEPEEEPGEEPETEEDPAEEEESGDEPEPEEEPAEEEGSGEGPEGEPEEEAAELEEPGAEPESGEEPAEEEGSGEGPEGEPEEEAAELEEPGAEPESGEEPGEEPETEEEPAEGDGEPGEGPEEEPGEETAEEPADGDGEPGEEDTLSGGESSALAVPSVNGKLQVIGTQLCDSQGNAVQLRGISTHGLAWFPEYVNQDCVNDLKSWGANVLRLAMYTAESGGYCTDGDPEALKDLVRAGVEYATEADMYVIVDWHILSEGTPVAYQAEAEAFFDEMSAEFADHDNVIYEICNEPNTADWSEVKAYAEDIIPIIRANDPDAVIIVGTPTWSQDVDAAAADPITGWDNIMYTLHFYAASHKDDLRDKMTAAVDAGLPVFVTEYGICDASGNGSLDIGSANTWVSLMNDYGISYVMWNLSNKDESSSILAPDVTKTSGFTYDDLSETGKWVYDMLGSAAAGTAELPDPGDYGDVTEAQTTDSGIAVSVSLRESWESEDGLYYLYDASVTNTADESVSSWSFTVTFDSEASLSDSWNGEFSLTGDTMTVSNADYNGSLAPGETAEDVGFIVVGGTDPQVS